MFGRIHRKPVVVAGIVVIGLFHGTPLRAGENDSISDGAIQEAITTLEEKLTESETATDKQRLTKAIEALRKLTKPSPATVTDKPEAGDAEESSEAKLPVPDDEAQKKATAIVKDVFKADYDKAKSQSQKLELAKKLLQEGEQTEDDPTGKFVLLQTARDLAVQAGDVSGTIEAIDQIGAIYDIDAIEMKGEELAKLAKSVSGRAAQKELVEAIEKLTDAVAEKEQYPVARQLAGLAITISRNSKDASLLKHAVAHSKEIDQNAAAYADAQKAMRVLEEKPTDPDANLIVGKFRCFNKNDWKNGLPLLALGNDARLKDLAEKESHGASETAEKVALGDGWWDISEKETGAAKAHLRLRAEHWYMQAIPNLTGLLKSKAEKRLAEIAATTNPPSKVKPVSSKPVASSKKGKARAKSSVFAFNDEKVIREWWTLTGNWRLENGGIKFMNESTATSRFTIKGDASIRVRHTDSKWANIVVTVWGQRFETTTGIDFLVEKRNNQVIFCEDGKTPEIVTLKEDEAPKYAETTFRMSSFGEHDIVAVAVQGEIVTKGSEEAPASEATAIPKPVAKSKAHAHEKARSFAFNNERVIKESWTLKGNWRLQNGMTKFIEDGNVKSRFTIRGDAVVTVKHTRQSWGNIDLTIWGQKFVAVQSGGFSVEKRGNQVIFCEDGKTPELVTLKEDEALRSAETGVFIIVGGGHAITEIVIQGDIVVAPADKKDGVNRPSSKTSHVKQDWSQFTFTGAVLEDGVGHIAKLSEEQKRNGDWKRSGDFNEIRTKDGYAGDLEITVVARTDKNNIRITGPRSSLAIFNWEGNTREVRITRPNDFSIVSPKAEPLLPGEWNALRFRVASDGIEVSINGNLVFSEKRDYDLSTKSTAAVWSWDSDLEVKSFVVSPITAK